MKEAASVIGDEQTAVRHGQPGPPSAALDPQPSGGRTLPPSVTEIVLDIVSGFNGLQVLDSPDSAWYLLYID